MATIKQLHNTYYNMGYEDGKENARRRTLVSGQSSYNAGYMVGLKQKHAKPKVNLWARIKGLFH